MKRNLCIKLVALTMLGLLGVGCAGYGTNRARPGSGANTNPVYYPGTS